MYIKYYLQVLASSLLICASFGQSSDFDKLRNIAKKNSLLPHGKFVLSVKEYKGIESHILNDCLESEEVKELFSKNDYSNNNHKEWVLLQYLKLLVKPTTCKVINVSAMSQGYLEETIVSTVVNNYTNKEAADSYINISKINYGRSVLPFNTVIRIDNTLWTRSFNSTSFHQSQSTQTDNIAQELQAYDFSYALSRFFTDVPSRQVDVVRIGEDFQISTKYKEQGSSKILVKENNKHAYISRSDGEFYQKGGKVFAKTTYASWRVDSKNQPPLAKISILISHQLLNNTIDVTVNELISHENANISLESLAVKVK